MKRKLDITIFYDLRLLAVFIACLLPFLCMAQSNPQTIPRVSPAPVLTNTQHRGYSLDEKIMNEEQLQMKLIKEDEGTGKLTHEEAKDLQGKLMSVLGQVMTVMRNKIEKNENGPHLTTEEKTHFYELMKVYKDDDLPQVITKFSDLKGDGNEEKIVLTTKYCKPPFNGKSFLSLYIYDKNQVIYKLDPLKDKIDEEALGGTIGMMYLNDFKVQPLRKGKPSQIYLNVHINGAGGDCVIVAEWAGDKCKETIHEVGFNIVLQDLENDGNLAIIIKGRRDENSAPVTYRFNTSMNVYQ